MDASFVAFVTTLSTFCIGINIATLLFAKVVFSG